LELPKLEAPSLNLKQALLKGYKPKSTVDEADHVFAELHRQAPVRLSFRDHWEGPRDTLKPLVNEDVEKLGVIRGTFGASIDKRGRRLLVFPVTLGHVVLREVGDGEGRFRNWASPKAQALEGVEKSNVDLAFVLRCTSWSGWTPHS
jgi:hypothetical protein